MIWPNGPDGVGSLHFAACLFLCIPLGWVYSIAQGGKKERQSFTNHVANIYKDLQTKLVAFIFSEFWSDSCNPSSSQHDRSLLTNPSGTLVLWGDEKMVADAYHKYLSQTLGWGCIFLPFQYGWYTQIILMILLQFYFLFAPCLSSYVPSKDAQHLDRRLVNITAVCGTSRSCAVPWQPNEHLQ